MSAHNGNTTGAGEASARLQVLRPHIPEGGISVKIIGCGGTGSAVARFGCMFLASLDAPTRVVLIDGDAFDEARLNASRAWFSKPGPKASVLRGDFLPFLAGSQLTLLAIDEYVTEANVSRLIRKDDYVLLCVDSHRARKLVNEHCKTLSDVTLISGGNDPAEEGKTRGTYGNVQCYIRRNGEDLAPDLGRFHPEIRNPEEKPAVKGCAEMMASVPQLAFTNLQVAACMCSVFLCTLTLGDPPDTHAISERCFDIGDGLMRPLPLGNPEAIRTD